MPIRSAGLFALPLGLAALLGACAQTPVPAPDEQVKLVCTTETTVGSTIAHRSCRAPMSAEERAALDRDITLHSQPKPNIKNN